MTEAEGEGSKWKRNTKSRYFCTDYRHLKFIKTANRLVLKN